MEDSIRIFPATVARMWHGRVRAADATAYAEYVRQSGLVEYRKTPGNAGAYILLRVEGQIAHVYTLSFWDSLDSIRAFAGDPIDTARYFPEDDRYLLEREPTVQHFSVVMP